MGGETDSFAVAGGGGGGGDAVALPEGVIGMGRGDVAEAELHYAAGEGGLLVRFQLDVGDGRQAGLGAGGEGAHAGLDIGHADEVDEVEGGFEGDDAGIVALAEDFEFAGAFEIVGPAGGDDEGPQLGDAAGADEEEAGFEGAHEPFVGAGGIGVAADFLEVDVEGAEGLGTVEVHPDAAAAGEGGDFAGGVEDAGGAGEMGDGDDACAGGDGLFDGGG